MTTLLHPSKERPIYYREHQKVYKSFTRQTSDKIRGHFGALIKLDQLKLAPSAKIVSRAERNNLEIAYLLIDGRLDIVKDNEEIIHLKPGEIMLISAGSGISYTEVNPSKTESCELIQIWMLPKARNIKPQIVKTSCPHNTNTMQAIFAPFKEDAPLQIHQDAYLDCCSYEKGEKFVYNVKHPNHGVYVFILSGKLLVGNELIQRNDGLAVNNIEQLLIKAKVKSTFLIFEVPMI